MIWGRRSTGQFLKKKFCRSKSGEEGLKVMVRGRSSAGHFSEEKVLKIKGWRGRSEGHVLKKKF